MRAMSALVNDIYPPEQTVRKPDAYHPVYDEWFADLLDMPVSILELGVHSGHSLSLWHRYFPKGRITGVDMKPRPEGLPETRVRYVRGRQEAAATIAEAATEGPFDIIIDDASHIGTLTRDSFRLLFGPHLKPGGLYVIEDTAASVKFPSWADYRPFEPGDERDGVFGSYDTGIMGFLKQVLDMASLGQACVAGLEVRNSIALIRKA